MKSTLASIFFAFLVLVLPHVFPHVILHAENKGAVLTSCTATRTVDLLPPKGFKINRDGPWSGAISAGELKQTIKFDLSEAKASVGPITLDCEAKASYEINAYYCNGDTCIRHVEKGEL
jgi:hypothetical protein